MKYRGLKPEVLAQLSANSNAYSNAPATFSKSAPTVERILSPIYTDEDKHQFYNPFMVASN